MLLDVRDLVTEIRVRGGALRAVDGASLRIARSEAVGLVGESGSGKSMTAFSLMRLFPTRLAGVAGGQILFEDRDLTRASEHEMRAIRGARMSMIFQDPASFLDPLMTVGSQIAEPLRAHGTPGDPDARVVELLAQLGLPDPASIAARYPHQLSGGQRQRVMIASAIACKPALLIADEPTTALDVTVQAQILDLLKQLRRELGLAILLITHDLGLVAELCDRVYVMYAGRIVEHGDARTLFTQPRHPYTQGLLRSTLSVENPAGTEALFAIPGSVPALSDMPAGCRFAPRCPLAAPQCGQNPPLVPSGSGAVACWRAEEAASQHAWSEVVG